MLAQLSEEERALVAREFDNAERILDWLQDKGFEDAARLHEKIRILVIVSKGRHLAKLVTKLEEAVNSVQGGEGEARLQLTPIAQFLDEVIAQERALSGELSELMESLLEPYAWQAQSSATKEAALEGAESTKEGK